MNHEHKLQQQSTLAAQLAAEKASSSSAAAVAHATAVGVTSAVWSDWVGVQELRQRMQAEQEQAAVRAVEMEEQVLQINQVRELDLQQSVTTARRSCSSACSRSSSSRQWP